MSLSSETSEAIAMTKVIVYTLPNGSTCVCHPCVSRDDPSGFTAEDALARALIKDIPADAISVRVVERSALPSDRSFRAAWRRDETVGIDIAAARNIHLARLRSERDAKLASTDGLIARAAERGDVVEQAKLAAYRQALRQMPVDIANALAAAETPEELRALRPAILDQQF
jgi:hypothetical protein